MVPMNAGASAAVAAAAAAEAERQRQEEEEMSGYPMQNLDDWEFKILRSAYTGFGTPEKLQRILEEEARAGWTLVEKFDDSRIRLKRPISARQLDHQLDFDPYRIWTGMTPNKVGVIILGVIFGTLALIVGSIAIFARR